ncbi:MAG TPA: peptidylprolyl isomerase [Coriobacteriia bacterium]
MQVKTGDTVTVHYRGTLLGGAQFDSSEGRDPLEFTVGAGQVIPGFEAALIGLAPGKTATVTIKPAEAYGPKHDELVQTVSLEDFATDPYVGGMVTLVSPEGDEMPGRIVAIDGEQVTLDFNHPLAGQTLVFQIELVGVESAEA